MATPANLIQRGNRASQPAATAVSAGVVYIVTDEGDKWERSNGTTWDDVTPTASGATLADGDYGDITASSSGTALTIDANAVTTTKINNAAVTLAKIQNAAASSKLLGSGASGSGAAYAEITLGTGLSMSGTTLNGSAGVSDGDKGDVVVSGSGATWTLDIPLTPGGRLTLTTGVPVMNADATAQGTVYYAPYVHARLPLYDGTNWPMRAFSQISLALNSTDNTSGSVYDVFVFDASGTLTLGTGPAWTSSTGRGTGAGTTELELKDGIWTNKVSITLKAGGSTVGTPAANRATYLGTIYCTANGQTGFAANPAAASGGSAPFVALSNAYNRRPVWLRCQDNKASWTIASVTWRASDNSNSNRATWVDGLQQSAVAAVFQCYVSCTAGSGGLIGLYLDAVSGTPTAAAESDGSSATAVSVACSWAPQLGQHFISGAEASATAATTTYLGSAAAPARQFHNLGVTVEY